MTPITYSIIIERSQADVFNFVTDFRNDDKWWKPVEHTEKITEGDMQVGSEFLQHAKVMFIKVQNHLKVTAWHPVDYVEYVNESNQLPYSLRYEFETVDKGTKFTLSAELEMKGLLRLLKPFTMRSLDRQLETYFGVLKRHLEQ